MRKIEFTESIGQHSLLLPAWVNAALAANDRLKLCFSALQSAWAHAAKPWNEVLDLSREAGAAGMDASGLRDLIASASLADGEMLVSGLPQLVRRMGEDLTTMARPLVPDADTPQALKLRVQAWQQWMAELKGERLSEAELIKFTKGQRKSDDDDSVHLLVMDLHKALNQLSRAISNEKIDGAHVWQLSDADRPLVAAFMRGLNRTAPLKFDHPGLDTAATRDGARLLIQNDIGVNDVHALVIQIQDQTITLTYSDLHRPRFDFFKSLLSELHASWSDVQSKTDAALNDGHPFTLGTAIFKAGDVATLEKTLEGIGSRIVFLIDWNRARKRLLEFTDKAGAIDVLCQAAHLEVGHMAFLKAGAEQMIFSAMRSVDEGTFRVGDRLDTVLGAESARDYLVDVLQSASRALLAQRPVALVADEARMLLSRRLRRRSLELELVEEHAAYCHALAQSVSDVLAHGLDSDSRDGGHGPVARAAARAKLWERQADHLVMRARDEARTRPQWQPFAQLLQSSDDVADAIEEAAFLAGLIASGHKHGWNKDVQTVVARLAQTVLVATQEYVKALAISRNLSAEDDTADSDAFLQALWNVLRSERQCDELLRASKRAMVDSIKDAPSLMLANDLASALELASDHLLVTGYALRDLVFTKNGVQP